MSDNNPAQEQTTSAVPVEGGTTGTAPPQSEPEAPAETTHLRVLERLADEQKNTNTLLQSVLERLNAQPVATPETVTPVVTLSEGTTVPVTTPETTPAQTEQTPTTNEVNNATRQTTQNSATRRGSNNPQSGGNTKPKRRRRY